MPFKDKANEEDKKVHSVEYTIMVVQLIREPQSMNHWQDQ